MAKFEAALLKATGQKAQGKKEERQAYLTRIAEAINDMDEKAYAKLPEAAQEWYESVVKATQNDASELPDYEEAEEEEAEAKPKLSLKGGAKKKGAAKKAAKEEVEEEVEEEEEEEEVKPKAGAKKAAKKAAAAKKGNGKAAAAPKKEKAPRWKNAKDKLGYRGMAEAIRHVVCKSYKNPPDFATVKKEVESRGFKGNESRMYDNYNHAIGTVRVLQELGKLA